MAEGEIPRWYFSWCQSEEELERIAAWMNVRVVPIIREAMKDGEVVLVRPIDKMVCCFRDGGIGDRIIIEFDKHHEATEFYWVRPDVHDEGKPPIYQMDVFETHLKQLLRDCERRL